MPQAEVKEKHAPRVLWRDLQEWQRGNHYITSGYRPASNSYQGSAASLGHVHNESVNIWTHLLGAMAAAIASLWLCSAMEDRYTMATSEDVLAFSCFFLGTVTCLGMSATFHTISNHSEKVAKFANQLDYIGIVALIWGSFLPSVHYGFRPHPHLVRWYWSMETSVAAAVFAMIFYPKFRSPTWRRLRAAVFATMGLTAVFPSVHGIMLYGAAQFQRQIGLSWLLTQGLLYLVGAAIYAARVPERWRPGRFDIWGSSHQIFHILVVLAAAAHLVGLLKAFDYEHEYRSGLLST